MHRIFHCLTTEHDLWMVALAGVICFLSSLTAVNLVGHARDSRRRRTQVGWLVTGAVAAGFGIWSTHFIAMLAYQPGVPVGYDLALTVASALIAIGVTGCGIAAYVLWNSARSAPLGGAVVGLGIASMHYVGMAAVRLPGYFEYDFGMVSASVALGVVLGAASFSATDRWRGIAGTMASTVVLTLAICTMHFSAMGALSVVPVAGASVGGEALSGNGMAFGIAAATTTVALLCLVSFQVDQHLVRRAMDEAHRLETLTDASTEGIVICCDDHIEYGNTAFLRMAETSADAVAAASLAGLFDDEVCRRLRTGLTDGAGTAFETTLCTSSGTRVPVELYPRRLEVRRGSWRTVLVLRDLSDQKRSQARIEYLAHHDALTGLANRARFSDRLEHDLSRAARTDEKVAVLCLDLDRFKEVNDTFGHGAGDQLLEAVAERLTGAVRKSDTVARLSGDEFAVVQVGSAQPDGARRLAARITEVMSQEFELPGGRVSIGASVGVAIYPDDSRDDGELLRQADTALYRAKWDGRNTYRFFEPDMDRAMRERRELEADLRDAIAREALHVEYQPLADAETCEPTGFEALVRWRHPTRGSLPPGEFIGLAEESGLIVALGAWVLRQACRDAAGWSRPLKVAVNLSPVQFRQGQLVQEVSEILAETGLAPDRLELEITEGVLLADREGAVTILTQLKSLGVSIAMDDFGTGYSSLSYLQSFPFDKIKIDRSFVAGLQDKADARAIVKAVIGLAHALGLPMVAEGVENDYQLDFLRSERCAQVQGFLIGRPAPIDSFGDVTASEAPPDRGRASG